MIALRRPIAQTYVRFPRCVPIIDHMNDSFEVTAKEFVQEARAVLDALDRKECNVKLGMAASLADELERSGQVDEALYSRIARFVIDLIYLREDTLPDPPSDEHPGAWIPADREEAIKDLRSRLSGIKQALLPSV